jgi:hypothetical protein
MEEEQPGQSPEESAPRLTFFRILCIATFLGSGLGLFSYLFCGIFYDSLAPAIKSSPFRMQEDVVQMLLGASRWFFITNAILFGFSLFGAIQMWNLHKTGFHFYAISQILMLFIPMLFVGSSAEMIPQAMVSGIFIFAYASNLRYMH